MLSTGSNAGAVVLRLDGTERTSTLSTMLLELRPIAANLKINVLVNNVSVRQSKIRTHPFEPEASNEVATGVIGG